MEGRACGGGVLRAAFGAADDLRGARAGRTYSDAGGRILIFRGDDDHGGIRRPISGDDHRPTDRPAADDTAEQTGRQAVLWRACSTTRRYAMKITIKNRRRFSNGSVANFVMDRKNCLPRRQFFRRVARLDLFLPEHGENADQHEERQRPRNGVGDHQAIHRAVRREHRHDPENAEHARAHQ